MAVRPSWEGHLRLSLATCPVALYPATSEAESVRFNLINPATNNFIAAGPECGFWRAFSTSNFLHSESTWL
jgi:non-homologous end joining protein Ku